MRILYAALIISVVLCLSACKPDASRYVEMKQFDETQRKLRDVQAQLDDAKKQLADFQSHRYSLFNQGNKTWRVDSATGGSCIQLAPSSDWKRKEVKEQSCGCTDYIQHTQGDF